MARAGAAGVVEAVVRALTAHATDAQLVASPSRAAGVDVDTEFRLRVFGGDLIQAGSVLLKLCVASPLPAVALASGWWVLS